MTPLPKGPSPWARHPPIPRCRVAENFPESGDQSILDTDSQVSQDGWKNDIYFFLTRQQMVKELKTRLTCELSCARQLGGWAWAAGEGLETQRGLGSCKDTQFFLSNDLDVTSCWQGSRRPLHCQVPLVQGKPEPQRNHPVLYILFPSAKGSVWHSFNCDALFKQGIIWELPPQWKKERRGLGAAQQSSSGSAILEGSGLHWSLWRPISSLSLSCLLLCDFSWGDMNKLLFTSDRK